MCNWRRKCVPDLPVSGCLLAGEHPRVGKSLQARDHADGQSRFMIPWRGLVWRFLDNSPAIHTKSEPILPRTCWAEVRSTVLLRASDDGWPDSVSSLGPCCG